MTYNSIEYIVYRDYHSVFDSIVCNYTINTIRMNYNSFRDELISLI